MTATTAPIPCSSDILTAPLDSGSEPSVSLYTTTYSSSSQIPRPLIALLKSYLPFSLPILGHLLAVRPLPGGPPGAEAPVTIFTSFAIDDADDAYYESLKGQLWSIGTYSIGAGVVEGMESKKDDYSRYFCSAEPGSETYAFPIQQKEDWSTVEEHVRGWMAAWVPLILYLYQITPKVGQRPELPLMIGAIHVLWVPMVKQEYVSHSVPCTKYLNYQSSPASSPSSPGSISPSSTDSQPLPSPSQEHWEIGPLLPSDVPRVVSTSKVVRTIGYITSRLPFSRCVRVNGESAGWAMIHGDGSIGGMFIEPRFRRRGFAKTIVDQLLELHLSPEHVFGEGEVSLPGILGWHTADVVVGNEDGECFFGRRKEWTKGWDCSWIFLR